MLKLYMAPGTSSLAVHVALRDSGKPFECVRVNLKTKQTLKSEDYLAINPKGAVPALTIENGETLTEVAVILQHINSFSPNRFADDGIARYRALEWLNFIATDLHKGGSTLLEPDVDPMILLRRREQLGHKLSYVDTHIAECVLGKDWTVVDAYLYTILRWAELLKFDFARWPKLATFMQAASKRPSIQRALQVEADMLRPS